MNELRWQDYFSNRPCDKGGDRFVAAMTETNGDLAAAAQRMPIDDRKAANPNTPAETLTVLATDLDDIVRRIAQKRGVQ